MPFEIVKNDIISMTADAIVYNGNPQPFIRLSFTPTLPQNNDKELKKEREKLGPISIGDAQIVPATNLDAKYVIHTEGPTWHGGMFNEINLLRSCYEKIFQLALEHQCESLALPMISSENLGFPKKLAQEICFTCVTEFLSEHDMMISIVVPGKTSIVLPAKIFNGVSSYIKKNHDRNKSDLILEYCELHQIDDLVMINQILFKFDQPCISSNN